MKRILGLLFCLGCGSQDAILELSLSLPRSLDVMRVARPQLARMNERDFGSVWDAPLAPVVLGSTTTVDHVSVLSDKPRSDLGLKVQFCSTSTCTETEWVERWFRMEQPLYAGEVTEVLVSIESIPRTTDTEPTVIPKCAILGCVSGPLVRSYCFSDGRHFCEKGK